MKNGKANGYGGEEHSEHEMHIWTERERRKKMKNMFSNLHALLPQLPSKADKSTIVDEAVKYIKNLQQTLQTLQKRKLEKLRNATMGDYEQSSIITSQVQAPESMEAFLSDQLGPSILNHSIMNTDMSNTFPNPISLACFQTWFSPSVVISMSGDDAHMCLFAEEARDISHHLVHSTKTPAGGGVCSHFL